MKKLIPEPQTVYIPVELSKRNPPEKGFYFTQWRNEEYGHIESMDVSDFGVYKAGEWDMTDGGTEYPSTDPTYWLEEIKDQYVLSKDQLIELLEDAYDTGGDKANNNGKIVPIISKETFIKNLLNC